ncbi:MAG: phosphopantothenoylcysteine decarboxylase, partial [Chitinophagaceae bacterium]|nr:phosphopantothenoylcysteine decarboxylase [Chitinophagaceae bacterium]
ETNNENENALNKLKSKKADAIVLNSLQEKGAGFKTDTNKISIYCKNGNIEHFDLKPKTEVAKDIVSFIANYK